MKFEMERTEATEQLEAQELQRNLETEPPKLESTSKKEEMPPRMERGSVLGGSIMEASIEARKAELSRLKEQLANERAKLGDMSLGETREEFNRRRAVERSDNKIQFDNRMKELEKAREEAERKKEEYRDRLYGK